MSDSWSYRKAAPTPRVLDIPTDYSPAWTPQHESLHTFSITPEGTQVRYISPHVVPPPLGITRIDEPITFTEHGSTGTPPSTGSSQAQGQSQTFVWQDTATPTTASTNPHWNLQTHGHSIKCEWYGCNQTILASYSTRVWHALVEHLRLHHIDDSKRLTDIERECQWGIQRGDHTALRCVHKLSLTKSEGKTPSMDMASHIYYCHLRR